MVGSMFVASVVGMHLGARSEKYTYTIGPSSARHLSHIIRLARVVVLSVASSITNVLSVLMAL